MKRHEITGIVLVALVGISAVALAIFFFYGDLGSGPRDGDRVKAEAATESPQQNKKIVLSEIEGDRGTPYEPEQPTEEAVLEQGRLAGAVIDEKKSPLENVRLTVFRSRKAGRSASRFSRYATLKPIRKAKSKTDGSYALGPLRPGMGYMIVAEHDLYAESIVENINITAGAEVALPPIVLKRGKTAYGWVRSAHGGALAGAEVAVYTSGFRDGSSSRDPEPDRIVLTDEKGRFRIKNIKQNNFTLTASAKGFERKTMRNTKLLAPSREFEFNFLLERGKTVSGTVVNAHDSAVEGALVQVYHSRKNTHIPLTTLTDPNGAFVVGGLGTGDHRLVVSHDDYSTFTQNRVAPVEAGGQRLVIRLEPRTGLNGQVLAPTGAPVTAFWINVKKILENGNTVELGIHRKYSHRHGRFVVGGLDPGTYVLEIMGRGHAATESGAIVVTRDFYADAGSITLCRGGIIRGMALKPDGSPLEGGLVSLKPDRYRPSRIEEVFGAVFQIRTRPVRTGRDGSFEMKAVSPGAYQVEINHRSFPAFRIDGVAVIDNGEVDVGRLSLEQGATLEGSVLSKGGVAVPGAKVRVQSQEGSFFLSVMADRTGRFRIHPLPAGRYKLSADLPRSLEGGGLFNGLPMPGEDMDLDLSIEEGETRSVIVTLPG